MTWTRFCDSCRAERTRVTNRRIAKERVQRLKDNRLCIWCGNTPVAEGNSQYCDVHREKMREFSKRHRLKKTRGDGQYTNCEVCGCLLRKNGNIKYCRPCSAGVRYYRIYPERKREKGLCMHCGKVPPVKDRVLCKECSAMKSAVLRSWRMRESTKAFLEQGLCTFECGKVPEGKTLRCDKCRLHKKKQDSEEVRGSECRVREGVWEWINRPARAEFSRSDTIQPTTLRLRCPGSRTGRVAPLLRPQQPRGGFGAVAINSGFLYSGGTDLGSRTGAWPTSAGELSNTACRRPLSEAHQYRSATSRAFTPTSQLIGRFKSSEEHASLHVDDHVPS